MDRSRIPVALGGAAFLAGVLVFAMPAAAVQNNTGAPPVKKEERLEDRLVPIPSWQPDVENNGCRLHAAPTPLSQDALTRLTEIPFWQLIENEVGRYSVRDILDSPEKFMASLAPLDPDMRTLVLLHTLQSGLGADGLHTYFYLKAGRNAPAVRDALAAAGLARPHGLFVEAMALFGSSYPVDDETRSAFFGYAAEPQALNPFDHRLLALAKEFGTRDAWTGIIVDYVNRTPALWTRIEAARMRLSDMDRLEHLTSALVGRIDFWKPFAEVREKLAALNKEQRTLLVLAAFNDEFENGGVHQFFYNSGGAIAPDVHAALLEIGLDRQAALLKRGIDMFGATYLRDTQERREAHFHNHDGWTDWDEELSGLTDEFYALDGGPQVLRIGGDMQIQGGPGLRYAMLAFANHHNMLPC